MDDLTPATTGDVQAVKNDVKRLEERVRKGFDNVYEYMDEKFGKMHEDINQVLLVLGNMDKRLTEPVANHEKRITRLEKAIV